MPYLMLIFAALLFTSCSTYYVSVLNSPDLARDDQKGEYFFENDSIKITYNFFGENAPISIRILNKLNQPLYIDWQRSALIIDSEATSFMGEHMDISGSISTSGTSSRITRDWTNTSSRSSLDATAALPQSTSFIPPRSSVERTHLELQHVYYQNIPDSVYRRLQLAQLNGNTAPVRLGKFSEESSPLAMTSYLTLYTINQENERAQPMIFEQDFYVSEVMKMRTNPKNLLSYQNQDGDVFFFREVKGKGWGTAGAIVAIAGAGIAADAVSDNNNNNYRGRR